MINWSMGRGGGGGGGGRCTGGQNGMQKNIVIGLYIFAMQKGIQDDVKRLLCGIGKCSLRGKLGIRYECAFRNQAYDVGKL